MKIFSNIQLLRIYCTIRSTVPTRLQMGDSMRSTRDRSTPKNRPNRGYPLINQDILRLPAQTYYDFETGHIYLYFIWNTITGDWYCDL